MLHDLIYVDKRGDVGDNFPDTWTYYRITSVTGLGNPSGTEGSTIQACRVKWPSLEDIPPVIDSPGLVRLVVAYEVINKTLKKQWDIEQERSIVVGIRNRDEEE
jgi:hypothetical protein